MKKLNLSRSALAGILSLTVMPGIAFSDQFFSKMDGKFRGSGTSVTDNTGTKRKVSCQITNTYKEGSNKLSMRGKCASSIGASPVSGSVENSNGRILGAYMALRARVKMLESSGKVSGNSMTIFSKFKNRKDGKDYKVKQVVKLTKAGFKTNFFTYDEKSRSYKSAGAINFKRK